jgi:hypothetical protein
MSWKINKDGKQLEFTEEMIPENAVGFVYLMTAIVDGKFVKYIGKKNFYSDVKTKLGKKEMPTDKRLKQYKRVRKFTYKNYYSSNEVLKEHYKNDGKIERIIIEICYSKIELTYKEVKHQFINEVLEDESYLNNNILGKFYKTTS